MTSGNIMAKALDDGGIGVYAVDTAKLLFTAGRAEREGRA